jgi:hypothetical protein
MSSREEMPASLHFKELLRKFNEHQVKYLVVGAYAVMKYTEPRYTKDFDIWVEPVSANAQRVFAALAEFGAPMNEVQVEDFANPELVFQIGIEPLRIDIMMGIKGLNVFRGVAPTCGDQIRRHCDESNLEERLVNCQEGGWATTGLN